MGVDIAELLSRDKMPDAAPNAGVVALRQAVADVADLLGDVEGEPFGLRATLHADVATRPRAAEQLAWC